MFGKSTIEPLLCIVLVEKIREKRQSHVFDVFRSREDSIKINLKSNTNEERTIEDVCKFN